MKCNKFQFVDKNMSIMQKWGIKVLYLKEEVKNLNSAGLTFGIYPLSVAGTPFGLAVGPEDNYEKIQLALKDLQGGPKKLLPRNYLIYVYHNNNQLSWR